MLVLGLMLALYVGCYSVISDVAASVIMHVWVTIYGDDCVVCVGVYAEHGVVVVVTRCVAIAGMHVIAVYAPGMLTLNVVLVMMIKVLRVRGMCVGLVCVLHMVQVALLVLVVSCVVSVFPLCMLVVLPFVVCVITVRLTIVLRVSHC